MGSGAAADHYKGQHHFPITKLQIDWLWESPAFTFFLSFLEQTSGTLEPPQNENVG